MWSKPVFLGLLLMASLPVNAASLDAVQQQLAGADYADALASLERLPRQQQHGAAARLLRAEAQSGMEDLQGAEQTLRQLIADYPELPEGYNNLAAVLVRQDRLDEARGLPEKALRTSERYATVYSNLLRLNDVVWVSGGAFLMSVVATLYPAWRAARTDPAEALRYE